MSIEAMKQWREALKEYCEHGTIFMPLTALKSIDQAIAEAEKQEPVVWQVHPFDYGIGHEGVYARTDRLEQVEAWKRKGWNVQPLYTHPQPKREWVGLTDDQIEQGCKESWVTLQAWQSAVWWAEAKLKEENT